MDEGRAGAACKRRVLGTRFDNRNSIASNAVFDQRLDCDRSGHHDGGDRRERSPLTCFQPCRDCGIQANFLRERKVNDCDDPQSPRFGLDLGRHRAERQAVDHDERVVRNRRQQAGCTVERCS